MAPLVKSNTLAFVQYLHNADSEPYFNMLPDKLIRHAVVMPLYLYVVVDVDRSFLPLSILVPVNHERFQNRLVELFKEVFSATVQLMEFAGVESFKQFLYGGIKFRKVEEGMMSQCRYNPSGHQENCGLHLCLVFWFSSSCRNHYGAVMLTEIPIRRIQVRLVPACFYYPGLKIIGNDDLSNAALVLKCPDMTLYPGREILRRYCCRIGVIRGAQHSYK